MNTFRNWLLALLLSALALVAQAQSPRLDPSFALTSLTGRPPNFGGDVRDALLQPDGKLIVAGDFIAVNGRPAVNVVRLLPDGRVDTAFAAPAFDGEVACLALQADGKLLVGGRFATAGGQLHIGIARLLPSGALDPSFRSPLGGAPPPFAYGSVNKIVIQPGRGFLVLGFLVPRTGTNRSQLFADRLLEATGAIDTTFRPGFDADRYLINNVLVLPNGHLVFAGVPQPLLGRPCAVWGTLPDGALDPAFVPVAAGPAEQHYALARDPATGKLYATRYNTGPAPGLDWQPVRLLPNGAPDPSFSTGAAFAGGAANHLAVQPNGRLLMGGDFPTPGGGYFGSARLLPSGTPDPSYDPARGPDSGVWKVLIQPDGKLVFAGGFQQAGGFALDCLARMLDPNVLGARAPESDEADALAVWPVPARDVLHLRLPAGRLARQVALLDALGRVVRRQAVPAGESAPALPVAGLAPGGYLLRVDFADGPPAYRRVAVE